LVVVVQEEQPMIAMNLRRLGVCLAGFLVAGAAVAAEPVFQAGFAERDITPEIGSGSR